MTNKELIAKIRAEIERLKATNPSEYNYQNAEGYIWGLDDVLSFLDTLEENQEIDHQVRFDKIISLMKESHKENRCFFESDDIQYLESLRSSNNLIEI